MEGVYFLPSYFRVPDTDLALFLASSLVRDNQHVQSVLDRASAALAESAHVTGSELAIRKLEGDLQAELLVGLHRIEFLLKHRALMLDDLDMIHRRLDFVTAE